MSDHQHTSGHCLEFFERFSELVDGEADDLTEAKVREHLAGCPECQVCFDNFKKSVAAFRRLGPQPVPPKVVDDIKDFIHKNLAS
jgi:anti-sigma factor RsiW